MQHVGPLVFTVLLVSSIGTAQASDPEAEPLTVELIVQQAYLKASNPDILDEFGLSVSVSGDTVVVGAPFEDSNATGVNGTQGNVSSFFDSGAAYVFVRDDTGWSQQAYLKASNPDLRDEFGYSVSVSGDTVVVGARFEDSDAVGVNGNQGNSNRALQSGAAYVFVRDGTVWSQQAYLKASNTGSGDEFGTSVSVSGDTVVVGARLEDSAATGVNGNQGNNNATNSGAAYVFVRTDAGWSQEAYLKASNTEGSDGFGWSVSVSGDTVVVGARFEDSSATGVNGFQGNTPGFLSSGAAYVFVRDDTGWSQEAYLKASNTDGADAFGQSVSVSHDTVVVGATSEDSTATGVNGNQGNPLGTSINAGAAYVFVRDGKTWSQEAYLKASNAEVGDNFGGSVSVSGDRVVVATLFEDSNATGVNGNQSNNEASGSGAAYVFVRDDTGWSQEAYLKASNTGLGDEFGSSASISGDTVVVGAPEEDSSATGVNGNQSSNATGNSGAAYVFLLGAPESFLVLGDGPSSGSFSGAGHTWSTQVSGITSAHAVSPASPPSFSIPAGLRPEPGRLPVPVGELHAQILVWDPLAFPANPEQWSEGLHVTLWSDGTATAERYGAKHGVTIGMETYEIGGERYVRFPFSIDGF